MRRLRLLALLTGTSALMAGAPVSFAEPARSRSSDSSQAQALGLLQLAANAVRSRTWSGAEDLASWHGGSRRSAVAEVSHSPERGTLARLRTAGPVRGAASARFGVPADGLDEQLIDLLAEHYDLRVVGPGRSAGRSARVVEARRPDVSGAGEVAARFWVDDDSSLLLRREVYDDAGWPVHSSSFVQVRVAPVAPPAVPPYAQVAVVAPLAPVGQRLEPADLDGLRARGWPAPIALPGRLSLYAARLHGPVLQLAYSDGLSTLSVFVQQGSKAAGELPGFARERHGRVTVWARHAGPEQVVWSGAGRTWTVLSDASAGTVRGAVLALPHDLAPPPRGWVLHRLCRGLSRVGSWFNPFH